MEQTKRSRFIATPTGKRFIISERDVDILTLLQRYRYLPSNYIAALLGVEYRPGAPIKDNLTKLRHEAGLIDCPNPSWAAANARYRPAVYALTKKGEAELKTRGVYVRRPKTGHEFNHELMVCLVQASFELGAREHGLTLITAQDILDHPNCPRDKRFEKEAWRVPVSFAYDGHRVEQHVESDGEFFGLANAQRDTLFFPGFEADRRTEPLEPEDYHRPSIKKKLIAYRELARQKTYKTRYGLPSALIAFVTINEAHKKSLMRVVDKLTDGHGSTLFLFKSIPNFASFENFPPPTGHMVREPWQRVGHPDFSILKELGEEVR
jgi:hypothetical protein